MRPIASAAKRSRVELVLSPRQREARAGSGRDFSASADNTKTGGKKQGKNSPKWREIEEFCRFFREKRADFGKFASPWFRLLNFVNNRFHEPSLFSPARK
jgi:hypothetical protein